MTAPSWQPDPFHRHEFRWWDGQQWTDQVTDQGTVGIDPHWAPPAAGQAAVAQVPGGTGRRGRRTALIGGAIVAVVALAVGGVVLLGGDDDSAAPTTTTAAPTSTTSTTTTTVAPTTTLPAFTDDLLMAAMPGAVDVPDDWSLYSDSDHQHDADADSGLCLGPNSSSLALSTGSIAGTDGPTFDLPDGGWFGVEAYAFADEETAYEFMIATISQVTCTEPVTWTVTESWIDVFTDPFGDDTTWDFSETVEATLLSDGSDEVTIDVTMHDLATTEVEGRSFSYRFDELLRYEQYGTVVVIYWLDGQYGFSGFTSQPDWVYEPLPEALLGAADAVRDGIRTALAG